jgi:hypothetical protein
MPQVILVGIFTNGFNDSTVLTKAAKTCARLDRLVSDKGYKKNGTPGRLALELPDPLDLT